MLTYKTYDDDELKHLQEVEFMILKDVVSICDKHNLDYYLYGGTLLGAVRHGDFIPWDDDIDIIMFREDYDKLLNILNDELDDKYEILSFKHQKDCFFPFCKISLKDTIFYEFWNDKVSFNEGIFIDIFVFDNIPDSNIKRQFQLYKCRLCEHIFKSSLFEVPTNTKFKRRINKLLHYFARNLPISNEFYINHFLKILKKYEFEKTDYVRDYFEYINDGIYRKDDITPFSKLSFRGFEFKVPYNYHLVLTEIYGDYMELPPKEKRYNHAPLELDFGKY